MNRSAFFASLRRGLMRPYLSVDQVTGCTALLDAWDKLPVAETSDLRWLAYSKATTYREAGPHMMPCREYGLGRGKPYGITDPITRQVYYGRGGTQTTWRANYEKLGRLMGLDLLHKPDLLLDPEISATATLKAMATGLYTGRSLGEYFSPTASDPVGARAIINGHDHAEDVAAVYASFLAALREAAAPGSALGAPIS